MRTVVLLSAFSACTSMDGTYKGECVMVMGSNQPFEVEVDITQAASGTLDGDGEMVDLNNTIFRGDIDGEWDGDEVSFNLEFDEVNGQWGVMTFKGLYDGSEIDGDCTLDDYKEGTFDLERQD